MELVDSSASLADQNAKLRQIVDALMRRVEQSPDQAGLAYAQFERAAVLEEQIRQRTVDLERTLDLLHESNARFALARQEAEDARAYLADAIETIDEGFALFDQNDRLVLFNSRFCRDLNSVRAALVTGLSFEDYITRVSQSRALDWQTGETPAGWRKTRLNLHQKDHVVFNIRLKGKRWMQVSEHRTNTGGTVILQMDVSEIMRLERRERDKLVNRQALMLRATLNHLRQGVCIFDSDRCLVDWNRGMERLLSRGIGSSLRGARFDVLLDHIDDLFNFNTPTGKTDLQSWVETEGRKDPLGFEVRREDGAIFDVFSQEMPDGGFVISFTDITQERKTSDDLRELNETLEKRVSDRTVELGKALEDARRANAYKTRFVAAASHDLLQPMSAAKLYASFLEERLDRAEDRELAHKTTSALESAESIITALLDISKLELDLVRFKKTDLDLSRMFQTLADEFGPRAQLGGVELRIAPTRARVHSDPAYLYRILQNIVSNAVRYTTGQKILVGARQTKAGIRIEIHDQGPGISAENQALIFQEFTQLDKGAAGKDSLGLGLAIVDRACRMLGHDLALRSSLGRGSCFSVRLDRVDAPVQPQTPRPAQGAGLATPKGLLVGLIENDTALSHSLSLTIEALGSDVLPSETAEAAMALYDELGVVPDCLLIDYQLGEGLSGTDLVPVIRERFGDLPVTIISADRSSALHDTCAALGVPLRHKPLSRDVVAGMLADMVTG